MKIQQQKTASLNGLLSRQIRKHFSETEKIPENLNSFLQVISDSYDQYEKDRTTLERSIELSSNELSKLFNNVNEVLYSVDMVSYKLIQISAASEKVYGYTSEEFLLNHDLWQNVIHPEDKHISEKQVVNLIEGKEVFNRYRIIHKDGHIRWIDNKIIPTLDETGKLIRLDGLTTDSTEKVINERKLEESEMRFRSLIENSADMLTLLDGDGNLLYESPAVTKTLDYVQGENIGLSGFELIHPDDHKKAAEKLSFIRENKGVPVYFAPRIKTKKGNYIFTEGNVTNQLHVEGINAIVCNFRDVTARIEAEQDLAESQERYKLVYENPFLGIAFGTIDGRIQNTNIAFANMLEYTPEELFNMPMSEFSTPEDLEKEWPLIQQMANGEIDNYKLEKQYITKSKKIIHVELSLSCSKNETDEIQFIIAVVQDITSRKKAEESLKNSELNLTAIIENSDAHIYSLDRNCCYITFNNLLKNTMLKKYNIDVKPGDKPYSFLETLAPGEAKFWKETYVKALEGQKLHFVKDYSTKTNLSYTSFSINPILENNTVIGLSCFSRDITQQKISEASLQKSEANMRAIFDNTETIYILVDEQLKIISFNPAATLFAKKELKTEYKEGVPFYLHYPEDRHQEMKEQAGGILKGEHISYEINFPQPDKSNNCYVVTAQPILNSENKIVGICIAANNSTEHKKTEQLIKLSNERYELVTKATNDVIWDWDILNNKIFRSENYKQVFGYSNSSDNIYVRSEETHVHPKDRERILNSIAEKIDNPKTSLWEDEYRYYRSNGELAYIQDRGYIIYDENKKPVRMVGAMRDITSSKLSTIERDKISSDLIRQNKDLEQFAYIVSHNLRAPVANILGLSRIIQTEKLDQKSHKISMEGLTSSVKKLDNVITDLNQILQVKREINEKKEKVQFSKLVDDIKLSVRNFLEEEDVRIYTDFSATNEIFTLKSYLHSIFYNLISNSIKYRSIERKPVLEISSHEIDNKIILTFKDNGMGIDLALHGDKVFGLYKRFHLNVEGKGMGLFMVKTQVETLGGKITVNSEIGNGTEFILEFEKQTSSSLTNQNLSEKKIDLISSGILKSKT